EYVIGFKGTRLLPFQSSPGLRDHVENIVSALVHSLPGESRIAGFEVLQRRLEVRLVNGRKIGAFLRRLFGQLRPTLRVVEDFDACYEPVELTAPDDAIAVRARAVFVAFERSAAFRTMNGIDLTGRQGQDAILAPELPALFGVVRGLLSAGGHFGIISLKEDLDKGTLRSVGDVDGLGGAKDDTSDGGEPAL